MIWVNGEAVDCVPATDRGLAYGDGLFETVAVRNGKPLLWADHWARLEMGCRRLGFAAPQAEVLGAEVERACADTDSGVLKVTVTRGPGGRGYRPPQPPTPTRIVACHPRPDYPPVWWRQGVRVRMCATRLGRNPDLAGIKHLNRLEQVLARAEWDEPDIAEGLMVDEQGYVVAGTTTNLFLVQNQRLLTPELSACGVAGIMRSQILAISEELGIPVLATQLDADDLEQAEEIFLTNSLIGLWPVREIANRPFPMGEVSQQLMAALQKRGATPIPAER